MRCTNCFLPPRYEMIKDRTCSTSNASLSLGRSLQVSLSLDRYKLTYKLTDTTTPLQSWHTCKFKMETIWGFVDQCCTWGRLFSLFLWDCRCQSVNLTGCHLGLLTCAKYLWVQVVGSQFWFSPRDQGGGPWINQWSTSTESTHIENPVLYGMVWSSWGHLSSL